MRRLIFSLTLVSIFLTFNAYSQRTNKVDQLLFSGQYESAIPLLKQLIEKDSADSKWYFRLGKVYQNLNQNKSAIENYQKALDLNPNSVATLYNYSSCLYSSGNYPAAKHELLKLQKIDSMHYQGNLLLAKTYTTLNDYNEGLAIYNKLVERDSLNPYLHKQIGNLKNRTQDYIGSLAAYLISYDLNPKDLSVVLHIIQKFYEMSAYDQALTYANNGLNSFPNNHMILKKKAQTLIGLEWYENALPILLDLKERKKLKLPDFKQLGICYMQTRKYKLAIKSFNTCGETFEKDPMINFYKGVCYSRLHDDIKGIKYLENAIAYVTLPIKASMHLHLAKAYNSNREFEKAVDQYQKHFKLDGRNIEVLYEIATTYEEYGDNKEEALKYYAQYMRETENKGDERYEYAKSRILHIKEKIHFEK